MMQKQDNRERFILRMPRSVYERLKKEAADTGVTLNAMILCILKEWAAEQAV